MHEDGGVCFNTIARAVFIDRVCFSLILKTLDAMTWVDPMEIMNAEEIVTADTSLHW